MSEGGGRRFADAAEGDRADGIRKFQGYFQRLLAVNPERWREAVEHTRIYFPDDGVTLGIVPEGNDALESRVLAFLAKTGPDLPEKVSEQPETVKVSEQRETVKVSQKPGTERYHTVRSGENLYRISLRYGVTVKEILRLNKLKEGAAIRSGQKLRVAN